MSNLQLPETVQIRIVTWRGSATSLQEVTYDGPPLAFGVRTFARFKNDYHLGPFFSAGGMLQISRSGMERSARIELTFGLMDYQALEDCYALVEIAHWSPAAMERAVKHRGPELTRGRFFSELETEQWGSPEAFVQRLRETANWQLSAPIPGAQIIRDEWDGSRAKREYVYRVHLLGAA